MTSVSRGFAKGEEDIEMGEFSREGEQSEARELETTVDLPDVPVTEARTTEQLQIALDSEQFIASAQKSLNCLKLRTQKFISA
jgi:hypothetical protein